jgi:hypothetical protein
VGVFEQLLDQPVFGKGAEIDHDDRLYLAGRVGPGVDVGRGWGWGFGGALGPTFWVDGTLHHRRCAAQGPF